MTTIGIFLPNWLGDVAMSTPALRAVRRHYGREAHVVGIMRPYLAKVLEGTGWLDEQWYFDPRSSRNEVRFRALVRQMRSRQIDVALLLPNSFHTALAAWMGGARRRIGYRRELRDLLLTDRVSPVRAGLRVRPLPMVDYYVKLTETLGCATDSLRLELTTTEADRQSADAVWQRLGLRSDGRVLLMNSSGAYGAAKLWPVEYFARLARLAVDRLDHDVLVMCGPNERQIARDIAVQSRRERVFSMCEQPMDLGTAKACIARGRLMVSTDSGPRHVAAALGKPVVTLFGPMLPVWSENPTQRAANLVMDLECIGCRKRSCPLGHHDCMRKLSVQRVYDEVVELLKNDKATVAA